MKDFPPLPVSRGLLKPRQLPLRDAHDEIPELLNLAASYKRLGHIETSVRETSILNHKMVSERKNR
jgi:hypothetical protein